MASMHSPAAAKTRALLTPRWIITTLLVIAAVAVMARLGFWQLERLEERRAFNARVLAQINAPELSLNGALQYGEVTGDQLLTMEYRPVVVTGTYDPTHEILLRNQVRDNLPGYHLITPLSIEGSETVVLVDRGFIPMQDADPAARAKYAREGVVTVRGRISQPHVPRIFGVPDPTLVPGQERLDTWNAVNLDRIQAQLPYSTLPVIIQAGPDEGDLVESNFVEPDITEGSHLGYAAQWFTFAGLLAVGYPFFVRKQINAARGKLPGPR